MIIERYKGVEFPIEEGKKRRRKKPYRRGLEN
jgi:hypothetical protein